jgi:hypothetical protein
MNCVFGVIATVNLLLSTPVYCFSLTSAAIGNENANYGGRSGSVRMFAILLPIKYRCALSGKPG